MRGTFIVVLGLALALAAAVSLYTVRQGPRERAGVHELGWTGISLAMLAILTAITLMRG